VSVEAARILVVEDNRDTSALLRDLLEAEGYTVESALTGEKALEILAENPDVDLLVLDLMLPGMSGYDVIEKLRSDGDLAAIPVLVLSALSSTSARIRGLRDGADDYMTKPFLPEELLARTRTLVTSRLLERRTRELQALAQIAQASLTAVSADVLLQRIVEIAAEVFGADVAVLFLTDEARQELRARAAVGVDVPLAGPDFFIIDFTREKTAALSLARRLRDRGASVSRDIVSRGLDESLAYARAHRAAVALVVGGDRTAPGDVLVMDLAAGTERVVPVSAALEAPERYFSLRKRVTA
jgi:CheY-like chemotaxis protein